MCRHHNEYRDKLSSTAGQAIDNARVRVHPPVVLDVPAGHARVNETLGYGSAQQRPDVGGRPEKTALDFHATKKRDLADLGKSLL